MADSNVFEQLISVGQSIWYDNIQRRLIESGAMAEMIARGEIRGVTSNPSIFNNAISKTHDYDSALIPMAWAGWKAEQIFNQLAVEDIRAAADLFLPLYQKTAGGDGYVSLEVSPHLAHDTEGTVAEALRFWKWVNRPNLMIKVPATVEGLPAITRLIAAGVNVNVTLIFSLERYQAVMHAYLEGLEQRALAGKELGSIASVASFFISRLDAKVEALFAEAAKTNPDLLKSAEPVLGKVAIANARLAYDLFKQTFSGERWERLAGLGAKTQRPLWASTSVKNPAYRDVLYIEELVGPDTVNTVPPQTLDAFRDHGVVRSSLEEDLEGSREVFDLLKALGLSINEITQVLEDEGVKFFVDAYVVLLDTIDKRRKAALAELGGLADVVADRVTRLDASQAAKKLHTLDATFWTSDPLGQREIQRRLGWLKAPERCLGLVDELKAFLAECQQAGFTHALLLGMGGSSLAPELFRLVFGLTEANGKPALDLLILDSTDPAQVAAAQKASPIDTTLFIVSSKSGSTGEINAFLDYFWARASHRLGKKAGSHFVAITDPGTSLEKLAKERGFRRVFNADPNVGGRYTALIEFGLVPAALIGMDVKRLLERGAWMAQECRADLPAARNPGVVLGAILGEANLAGRDKLTLLSETGIEPMGAWLEQLVAESSGKQGKGIVPVDGEPVDAVEHYSADRIFVHLRWKGEKDALAQSLRAAGHPVLTLPIADLYDLGAEFYRWEVATAIACAILGINAFDQPDVQDSKDRTLKKVAAFKKMGCFEEGDTIWQGEEAIVYGWDFNSIDNAASLTEIVKGFVSRAKEGDYIAINAYLPRNPKMEAQLQKLRALIQATTGRPTTLGFGPRFLHSTGQLHKGGGDNGLFLQITADPAADLEIPGQEIHFGTFQRAQALGDLEALRVRGKRAIRVHLSKADVKDLYFS